MVRLSKKFVAVVFLGFALILTLNIRSTLYPEDSTTIQKYLAPDQPGRYVVAANISFLEASVHNNSNAADQVNETKQKLPGPKHAVNCASTELEIPHYILANNISSSGVTCAKFIAGDTTDRIYEDAKTLMDKLPIDIISDTDMSSPMQDCKKFKATRGYHIDPGSVEEMEFPIAYNMLVHKEAQQVEFLLRAIYRPQNQYCIHADAKASKSFLQAMQNLAGCFDNVFMASKLERVVYAGFTRLQADINCMKDHLNRKTDWKYLFNVAGQAFPVKTNREMVEILKIYNGSNDIEGIFGKRIHKSRFENEYKEVDVETDHGKLIRTGKKNPKPPFDIDIVRGSAYGVFSRKFVDFIINDEKAQALLNWSRNTWSPDEHYWATLHHTYTNPHLHTPGGYSGKPDDKPWLAVWVAWGGPDKCNGKWVRGTCVFGVGDLPMLTSRHEFFVNKLYYNFQPLTLQCLNSWLEQKVNCPVDIDRDFYNKLPFVAR